MSVWVEIICDECSAQAAGAHAKTNVSAGTIAGLRADAKVRGWTSVPDPNVPGWTLDYCRECSHRRQP